MLRRVTRYFRSVADILSLNNRLLKAQTKSIRQLSGNLKADRSLKGSLAKSRRSIDRLTQKFQRVVVEHKTQARALGDHGRFFDRLFQGAPPSWREDTQLFARLFKLHGPLRSTAALSQKSKFDLKIFFDHKEKSEVTLTVASSWYGGDYFELGAHDLNTFRNMLSAFDLFDLQGSFPDTRFYAFDIFGSMHTDAAKTRSEMATFESRIGYFAPHLVRGDQYQLHLDYVKDHGLFEEQCILVQGFFQDTLNPAFKANLLDEGRRIGFAFLDCNMTFSYKIAFDFIFDLLADNSYIYMDEYFQNAAVCEHFETFKRKLREERRIGCVYVRNAAGFGGLFRLYPVIEDFEAAAGELLSEPPSEPEPRRPGADD